MICRVEPETGWRTSSEKPDRSPPGIAWLNCLAIQWLLVSIQRLFSRQNNIIAWCGHTGPVSRFSGLFVLCGSRVRGAGAVPKAFVLGDRCRHLGRQSGYHSGCLSVRVFSPGNGRAASSVAETARAALLDARNCLMWFLGLLFYPIILLDFLIVRVLDSAKIGAIT